MAKYSFAQADLLDAYMKLPEQEFIIAVTHDIRHCCTAILAFGELIQMGMDSGDAGTQALVENYVGIVPLRIADMGNVLDAAIEYDLIHKGKQHESNGNVSSQDDTVDGSMLLEAWAKEPEHFIPTFVAYVRNRAANIPSGITLMRQDLQEDSTAKSPALATHLSEILVHARDIVSVTTMAVEHDERQNARH
jgi:hypothetical protein